MDLKDQAFQGLQQESYLEKVREQLRRSQEAFLRHDRVLLDLESERKAKEMMADQLAEQAKHLKTDLQALKETITAHQDEQEVLKSRRLMLEDFAQLLQGNLFRGTADGAGFFTHSLENFAQFYEVGPLGVKMFLDQSKDGISFSFQDKTFLFVKGVDGSFYFHPMPVDLALLLKS